MSNPISLSNTASVRFRRQVLNADETPAAPWSEWTNNLILDVGLDRACGGVAWFDFLRYLALGTGTTPTKRDSGTVKFTRSGSTVTADAAFFEAADVNRRIKFDSGEVMKITAYASNTSVTVDASGTLAAAEGTVWYTNETGHGAEFGTRSETASTDSGANADTFLAGVWTRRRTIVSNAFDVGRTVKEVGWSDQFTGTLFGRALVPGGGDYVAAGKKYKLQIELSIDYSPKDPVALSEFGVGISSLGYFTQQYTPAPTAFAPCTSIFGGIAAYVWATSTAQTPLGISGTTGNNRGTTVGDYKSTFGWLAYTSGSFKRRFQMVWDETASNGSGIRCFYSEIGYMQLWSWYPAAPVTKDNAHKLTLEVEVTAGRVLNN